MTAENKEMNQLVNDIRELTEKGLPLRSEDKERIEKANARLDVLENKNQDLVAQINAEKTRNEELTTKYNAMEAQMSRLPAGKSAGVDGQDQVKEIKSFLNVMLKNGNTDQFIRENQSHPIVELSKKTYLESIDPQGGYLVPPQYYQEILKKVTEISPIRQYAKSVQISRDRLIVPKRNNLIASQWLGEAQEATASGSQYGTNEIHAFKLTAYALASVELLNDAEFNMEQQISEDIIEEFARAEGEAFVLGNGTTRPAGLIQNPDIETQTSSVVGSYNSDDLIRITGTLKEGYDPMWMLNRKELARIRLFKDGVGRYLWTPGLAEGKPSMINGEPYVSVINMPDAAAGATPVLYGDVRRGYMIVDNMRMTMLRDPYTSATQALIRYVAHRRVGGYVVMPEALKLVLCAS